MNIELTEVKRQSDENLVTILNRLRLGQCGENETRVLAGKTSFLFSHRKARTLGIIFCTKRKEGGGRTQNIRCLVSLTLSDFFGLFSRGNSLILSDI